MNFLGISTQLRNLKELNAKRKFSRSRVSKPGHQKQDAQTS